MAQRFDAATLQVEEDPFVVAAPARATPSPPASVSGDGTLAYLAGGEPESKLTWFDRSGKVVGDVGPRAGMIWTGVLSPDAARVLFVRSDEAEPNRAWLYDPGRGSTDRLSPTAQSAGNALWSPDGNHMWMALASPEGNGWYQKDLRSGAITELVALDPSIRRYLSDWSRDGRYLVYTEVDPKTGPDIWWAPIEAGKPNMQAAVKFRGTQASESYGQLSPDGRFLAYVSDESGSYEVHVRSFPSGATDWKVPGPGARSPRWSPDGRELFFIDYQPPNLGTLMAVSVVPGSPDALHLGVPRTLFSRVALPGTALEWNRFLFSPHPDGQRFLMNALTGDGLPRITVITQWPQAVVRRTQGTSR
jgi:dipeptidyl aminopeptidase/acylaminoacyl peptidase